MTIHPPAPTHARPTTRTRRVWLRMFLTGLTLWLLTVVVTLLTGNPNLIPTLVLLGSFLVPVTFVAWAFSRRDGGEVTVELLFSTFITGGVLGVLAASLLEAYLLRGSWWLYLGVGLIEEAVKLAALAFLTRHLVHKHTRDGLILGAAVGFGFAGFESAGYAFTALFGEQGLSVVAVIQTEVLRGLLAPLGHGVWTAILGGVLFSTAHVSTAHGGRFGLSGRLILSYLGVSLLHALWNSTRGIALLVTLLLTGSQMQYQQIRQGQSPKPTETQIDLLTLLTWSGLILVGLLGVGWLLAVRTRAARQRRPEP